MHLGAAKLSIRELPRTKRTQIDDNHPVKKIQEQHILTSEKQQMQELGAIYGSALPMMLTYERQILGQPERLPGLKSSFSFLECHMGRLNKLDFDDVLNKGDLRPRMTAHEYFERE